MSDERRWRISNGGMTVEQIAGLDLPEDASTDVVSLLRLKVVEAERNDYHAASKEVMARAGRLQEGLNHMRERRDAAVLRGDDLEKRLRYAIVDKEAAEDKAKPEYVAHWSAEPKPEDRAALDEIVKAAWEKMADEPPWLRALKLAEVALARPGTGEQIRLKARDAVHAALPQHSSPCEHCDGDGHLRIQSTTDPVAVSFPECRRCSGTGVAVNYAPTDEPSQADAPSVGDQSPDFSVLDHVTPGDKARFARTRLDASNPDTTKDGKL